MQKVNISGLTPDEILKSVDLKDMNRFHALKIVNQVYKKGKRQIGDISGIPARLRKNLDERFIVGSFPPKNMERSEDGSVKYLFETVDGRRFESVYLPDKNRHTLCISSQSGCRMGCPFCATGTYGFYGNLSVSEIINQVMSIPESVKITHVVFMGMGEPMDNYENVLKACELLTAEWGFALSYRNITVSSVGIAPFISRFLEESSCNLTVSLFSPFFDERKKVVPVENKYPVRNIIETLKAFPLTKKRRFTLSYMMIGGLNDTDAHLHELKKLLLGSSIRVNLLPYHPAGDDKYVSSPYDRMLYFKHELVTSGISASIRKSRGADISAACGLLASR